MRANPLALGSVYVILRTSEAPDVPGLAEREERQTMEGTRVKKLKSAVAHAQLSHAYWLSNARRGGIGGRYGRAYCIEGAAIWRRRLAELLAELRSIEAEAAR
jgi:hypothetical protein